MNAHHEKMLEKVGEGILQAAEAHERQLDEQLKSLEKMGKLFGI